MVKKEILQIDRQAIENKKTNINSVNGRYESQKREMLVTMTLFTNSKKNIIVGLIENNTVISEGDFGSYTKRGYAESILFLANSPEEYNAAIKTFRSGNVPNNVIIGDIISNYDCEHYHCNNDFPFTISVSINNIGIEQILDANCIPLDITFHDDFVFWDGLHAYMPEFNATHYFAVTEFLQLFNNNDERIKLLWSKMKIDKHWNCVSWKEKGDPNAIKILNQKSQNEDLTFREVIIRAIKSAKIKPSKLSIKSLIDSNTAKVNAHKELEIKKEREAKESNKRYKERTKHETFLTEKQKTNITISEIDKTIELNKLVIDLQKIFEYSYKSTCIYTDYYEFLNMIFDKMTKPNDGIDIDFAFQCIKLICHSQKNSKVMLLDNKLEVNHFLNCMAEDLGCTFEQITVLAKLPLKTFISLLKYIKQ